MRSPHWWPSFLPSRGLGSRLGEGRHPLPGGCLGEPGHARRLDRPGGGCRPALPADLDRVRAGAPGVLDDEPGRDLARTASADPGALPLGEDTAHQQQARRGPGHHRQVSTGSARRRTNTRRVGHRRHSGPIHGPSSAARRPGSWRRSTLSTPEVGSLKRKRQSWWLLRRHCRAGDSRGSTFASERRLD